MRDAHIGNNHVRDMSLIPRNSLLRLVRIDVFKVGQLVSSELDGVHDSVIGKSPLVAKPTHLNPRRSTNFATSRKSRLCPKYVNRRSRSLR